MSSEPFMVSLWACGACGLATMLIGYWLRCIQSDSRVDILLDRLFRENGKEHFWDIAESIRHGENLEDVSGVIDELLHSFRYYMTMGETIYDAHPESEDREMFRKILDEGWEVYGRACTRDKNKEGAAH